MTSQLRVGAVTWSQTDSLMTPFDVTYSASGTLDRWLIPGPPGSDQPFSPLTAWWILLFGLSIFARYDPALWVGALNLDSSSGRALPLQLLLDDAIELVPNVVADALITGTAAGNS